MATRQMDKKWKSLEGLEAHKIIKGRVSGHAAVNVPKILKALEKVKEGVALKGNLFDPVLTTEYPGYPAHVPINLAAYPERKMDFFLFEIKPGHGFPYHTHDYADEVYLIIKGVGKVIISNKEYDAKPFDVFYVPSGIWHTGYNPKSNKKDFCVWIVQTPALANKLKAKGWSSITSKMWGKLGYEGPDEKR